MKNAVITKSQPRCTHLQLNQTFLIQTCWSSLWSKPKVDRLITVECSEYTVFFTAFFGKVNKVATFFWLFMFKCTVLLLPAHLPDPTLCWGTKRPGSSYPLSSACIIICNASKKSLKALEKIKTKGRGLQIWVNWGRTFPPADEVWYKDMLLTGFYQ